MAAENEEARPPPTSPSSLLSLPAAHPNFGRDGVFTRHFRGRLKRLEGRRGDEREEGAAAAYISQCTQRTGHLIYIEPHWFLTRCGVRCGSRERSPTIKSAGVMGRGGEHYLAASGALAHAEPREVRACLKAI